VLIIFPNGFELLQKPQKAFFPKTWVSVTFWQYLYNKSQFTKKPFGNIISTLDQFSKTKVVPEKAKNNHIHKS